MASEQAEFLAKAITRQSLLHLEYIKGHPVVLTADDLIELYRYIGGRYMADKAAEALGQVLTVEDVLRIYDHQRA